MTAALHRIPKYLLNALKLKTWLEDLPVFKRDMLLSLAYVITFMVSPSWLDAQKKLRVISMSLRSYGLVFVVVWLLWSCF